MIPCPTTTNKKEEEEEEANTYFADMDLFCYYFLT